MYTVRVDEPDPRFGNMLLEQFGGANGELAAAMQYSVQGINCDDAARKDLLMDIGTEELSHLEIVGMLARMHLKPLKSVREEAEADPLIAIAGGGGVNLVQLDGQCLDRRLPEDHRRTGRRSSQQHRRRSARQDRLRAPDQLLPRLRHQGCAAVPHDPRDHAHAGLHARAGKHGQAAVQHRQDRADAEARRPVLQRLDRRRRERRSRRARAVERRASRGSTSNRQPSRICRPRFRMDRAFTPKVPISSRRDRSRNCWSTNCATFFMPKSSW